MIWIDEDFRTVWRARLEKLESKLIEKCSYQGCDVGT